MPTYEYKCNKCGHMFEHVQKMSDAPLTDCPKEKCKGKVQRLISAGTGLIFKGSGFYETDYKKKNGGGSSGSSKKSPCAATCPNSATCPAASGKKDD